MLSDVKGFFFFLKEKFGFVFMYNMLSPCYSWCCNLSVDLGFMVCSVFSFCFGMVKQEF